MPQLARSIRSVSTLPYIRMQQSRNRMVHRFLLPTVLFLHACIVGQQRLPFETDQYLSLWLHYEALFPTHYHRLHIPLTISLKPNSARPKHRDLMLFLSPWTNILPCPSSSMHNRSTEWKI